MHKNFYKHRQENDQKSGGGYTQQNSIGGKAVKRNNIEYNFCQPCKTKYQRYVSKYSAGFFLKDYYVHHKHHGKGRKIK